MDDEMIDLLADDGNLRRRLEAYAEARLSPDLAASARIRARVLAVAHRQSALTRSDATLALLPEPDQHAALDGWRTTTGYRESGRSRPWRRTASVLMAATLGLGLVAGTVAAARPGGAFYGARLWAETLTLPVDPSERAIAELDRLAERLAEATSLSASGDTSAASAAIRAYESIMSEATANAVMAGSDVASAALETGVSHNVVVLQALLSTVPDQASPAIQQVIGHAIERTNEAFDTIHASQRPNAGGGNGGGGEPAVAPTPIKEPKPTPAPKPTPEPKPTRQPPSDRTDPQGPTHREVQRRGG
ncbi:MAG: DUF5667 domain-containing protein [Candidatus Limnocylindrales bacterium]